MDVVGFLIGFLIVLIPGTLIDMPLFRNKLRGWRDGDPYWIEQMEKHPFIHTLPGSGIAMTIHDLIFRRKRKETSNGN